MVGLASKDGKLLTVDGKLVLGDCYCNCYYEPECPNCCIRITWGEFDEEGNLFEDFTEIRVTLEMPTPNSRLVCDGHSVDVVITIKDPESTPAGTPYVTWDRHWQYGGTHSPVIDSSGMVDEDGLIEWGYISTETDEYRVTLDFDSCWADNAVQYGDIEAGLRGGEFALIIGENCNSVECCEPVFPCDDCCWYMEPYDNTEFSYELNDNGDPVFWAVNAAGDKMKVTVVTTSKNGVFCLDDSMVLQIKMIPHEWDGTPWTPEVSIHADGGWEHVASDPDVGTGNIVVGPDPPMEINWGAEVDELAYEATLQIPCPELPDTLTVAFANGYPDTEQGAGIEIRFSCCSGVDAEFSCESCWPTPSVSYIHCQLALILGGEVEDECDLAVFGLGGADGTWTLLAVWENYASPPVDPTLSSERVVHYLFRCCAYDGESCTPSSASDAFRSFVEDTYDGRNGQNFSNGIDCDTGLLPVDGNTIQDVLDSTADELNAPSDHVQVVYFQADESEVDCPECPDP